MTLRKPIFDICCFASFRSVCNIFKRANADSLSVDLYRCPPSVAILGPIYAIKSAGIVSEPFPVSVVPRHGRIPQIADFVVKFVAILVVNIFRPIAIIMKPSQSVSGVSLVVYHNPLIAGLCACSPPGKPIVELRNATRLPSKKSGRRIVIKQFTNSLSSDMGFIRHFRSSIDRLMLGVSVLKHRAPVTSTTMTGG